MNNLLLLKPKDKQQKLLQQQEILQEFKQFNKIYHKMGGDCAPNYKSFQERKANLKCVDPSYQNFTPSQLKKLFLLKTYIKHYEDNIHQEIDTQTNQQSLKFLSYLRNFFEPFLFTNASKEVKNVIQRVAYMKQAQSFTQHENREIQSKSSPVHHRVNNYLRRQKLFSKKELENKEFVEVFKMLQNQPERQNTKENSFARPFFFQKVEKNSGERKQNKTHCNFNSPKNQQENTINGSYSGILDIYEQSQELTKDYMETERKLKLAIQGQQKIQRTSRQIRLKSLC